jgi:sulfonate transport system permease protein
VKQKLATYIQAAIVPVLLLGVWEVAVRFAWWPRALIASPTEVLSALWELIRNGELARHVYVSLLRLGQGFGLGAAVGVLLGTAIGLWKWCERVWLPTIQLLAPIPIIAWIPLLIILSGIDGARLLIVALGSFFLVLFGTVEGIRSAEQELVDIARLYEKSWGVLVWEILIPSALPSLFQALKTALAMSWVLLIMAEIIASSEGLGWLIWNSRNFSRADDMIVGMIVIGMLGKLTDAALVRIQHRMLWWRATFQGQ